MNTTIPDNIHDPEILLALEAEELAGVLLEYFNSIPNDSQYLNKNNFFGSINIRGYPEKYQEKISRAFMEAWIWLEREILIAPKPKTGEWIFITRRGERLKNTTDFQAYLKANLLPQKMLHPVIAQKVWSPFIRGEYDTAVFQAFKEIEVAVRFAGGFDLKDYGKDLMRKAFNPNNGPLMDETLPKPERESMSDLFAGSIGLFKNPHSHRNEPITEPVEAVEMIMLASHLMRIVDSRVKD